MIKCFCFFFEQKHIQNCKCFHDMNTCQKGNWRELVYLFHNEENLKYGVLILKKK